MPVLSSSQLSHNMALVSSSLHILPKNTDLLKVDSVFSRSFCKEEEGESGGGQLQSSSPMHLCFKCSLKLITGTFYFMCMLCDVCMPPNEMNHG